MKILINVSGARTADRFGFIIYAFRKMLFEEALKRGF